MTVNWQRLAQPQVSLSHCWAVFVLIAAGCGMRTSPSPSPHGVSTGDTSGVSGATEGSPALGAPCSTQDDCPSGATCCNGSEEGCDGVRLPSGDGTNAGEFVVSPEEQLVTDTITGLAWQREGSAPYSGCANQKCTWAEAKLYCETLTLGSRSDWRLPAVIELSTIVDFAKGSGAAIDATAFPNALADDFWSTSPLSGDPGFSWYVQFDSGETTTIGEGSSNRVRCVRGSRCYPTSPFQVLLGGMVRQTLTGLLWQQDGSGARAGCSGSDSTCTWAEAGAYCAALSLGHLSGWRLPTVKELRSIVDHTLASPGPMIALTAFPDTQPDWYWTSSAPPDGNAWAVNFSWGASRSRDAGEKRRVRCVR